MAAIAIANELLPLIVLVDGHAFLGLSLKRTRRSEDRPPKFRKWDKGRLDDLVVLRELAGSEYLFVECTGAAYTQGSLSPQFPEGRGRDIRGAMSFERACAAGQEQILSHAVAAGEPARADQRAFLYALDIHDLQTQHGFTPEAPEAPAATSSVFNQAGQTVHGTQTNIAGNVQGPILSGNFQAPVQVGDSRTVKNVQRTTHQSGGVNLQGPVNITGDLVGRDKVTQNISVGNVSGTGIAIGHGARATVTQTSGASAEQVARVFAALHQKVSALPDGTGKEDAQEAVQKLETEAKKAGQADERRVRHNLEFLVEVLPDAWDVTVATVVNPLAGLNTVFKKIAERVKAEKGNANRPSG
jgi:hypothetical protein